MIIDGILGTDTLSLRSENSSLPQINSFYSGMLCQKQGTEHPSSQIRKPNKQTQVLSFTTTFRE